MQPIIDPITATPPAEVALPNAPLVRVIAQIRFPMVAAIGQQEFIAPFQEAIRKTYPVLRPEQVQNLVLNPGNPATVKSQLIWRFTDVGGNWRVSLAPDFLALETPKYTNRADFIARLRDVVAALDEHVEPKLVDRLGLRYVNRVRGEIVKEIASLVRPEVAGITASSIGPHTQHVLSETLLKVGENRLMARWGCLPPQVTVDPAAIEPIDEPSWIFDLDMFTPAPFEFDPERIATNALSFTERMYAVFRWAVKDEFLSRHGGKP